MTFWLAVSVGCLGVALGLGCWLGRLLKRNAPPTVDELLAENARLEALCQRAYDWMQGDPMESTGEPVFRVLRADGRVVFGTFEPPRFRSADEITVEAFLKDCGFTGEVEA